MTNRFFVLTDASGVSSDSWYRLETFASTTSMALSQKYEGTTASGLTYMIAQSPDIPEELHEYIPYDVASKYYMTRRQDLKQAKAMANYFYTGDFDNPQRRGSSIKGGILATLQDLRERGRSNTNLVEMGGVSHINYMDNIWGTVLSAP